MTIRGGDQTDPVVLSSPPFDHGSVVLRWVLKVSLDSADLPHSTLLMNGSSTIPLPKRLLSRLKHRAFSAPLDYWELPGDDDEREHQVVREPPVPPSLNYRSSLQYELEAESLNFTLTDNIALPHEPSTSTDQELLPPLQSPFPLLDPYDIGLMGEHPIASGGFADIWEASHHGRKVVLKSYRCYETLDVARNEVRCNCRLPREVHG